MHPWNANTCDGYPGFITSGLTQDEVLIELPDLELEDIQAALKFASSKVDHPIIAA